MLGSGKLKKSTDSVFKEIEEQSSGRRLEWRKGWNGITFKIIGLKVVKRLNVNDFDISFDADEEKLSSSAQSNIYQRWIIKGTIDSSSLDDNLYYMTETEESDVYEFERVVSPINVEVMSLAHEERESIPGAAYRINYKPGVDYLSFSFFAPEKELQALCEQVINDDRSEVIIATRLLSFTFEVDDALREPWHSRDIGLLEDGSRSIIESISVEIPVESKTSDQEPVSEDDLSLSLSAEKAGDEEPKLDVLPNQTHGIRREDFRLLTYAVWALVILFAIWFVGK